MFTKIDIRFVTDMINLFMSLHRSSIGTKPYIKKKHMVRILGYSHGLGYANQVRATITTRLRVCYPGYMADRAVLQMSFLCSMGELAYSSIQNIARVVIVLAKQLVCTGRRNVRYDVWAQLPASFVYAQHSSYPFRSDPGVIVGAEKNCWPFSRRDPQCRDLPESPLPRDVYGEETDKYHAKIPENSRPALSKDAIYEYGPLDTIRPRFLNSGSEWSWLTTLGIA